MKIQKIILINIFSIFLACICFNAYADTLLVPEEYDTIQQGIDAAVDGDTVLVNDGTYAELINFLGKAIMVKSVNGAEKTIIDGDDIANVVTFDSGEDSQSIFEGFTVLGDYYSNFDQILVYCLNSSPIIRNNRFSRSGYNAIHCDNFSSPLIEDNDIYGSKVYGILCTNSSSSQIKNNRIIGSMTGIAADSNSALLITENIISGHTWWGIAFSGDDAIIMNNTIIGNYSGIRSSGYSALAVVKNNIIAGCHIGVDGIGVEPSNYSFNNVWESSGYVGQQNISEDPLFEAYTPSVSEGESIQDAINNIPYLLGEGSPCIGSGENGVNIGAYPQQAAYGTPGEIIISVNSGVYQERIVTYSGVQLIGENAQTTILDGEGENEVIFISIGRGNFALKGFTIKNGTYSGIWVHSNVYETPLITKNVITANGQGIRCDAYSKPDIVNNIITANNGRGIFCEGHSHPSIIDNTIDSNEGAGIDVSGANYPNAYIVNNLITNNQGDGIVLYDGVTSTEILNNIITYNADNGIGVYWNSGAAVMNNVIAFNGASGINHFTVASYYIQFMNILNNIITGNGDYGIRSDNTFWSQYMPSDYNDVWNNPLGNFDGYAEPGPNDIFVNPLFVDSNNAEFSLIPGSPCIDAGNPDPVYDDPDGTRNDMGVYGGPQAQLLPIVIMSPQQNQVVNTLTPTIAWITSGLAPEESLRLIIKHKDANKVPDGGFDTPSVRLPSKDLSKDGAASLSGEIGSVSLWSEDLNIIVPNTGSYQVPVGIIEVCAHYMIVLSKESDSSISDSVRFTVIPEASLKNDMKKYE